MVAIGTTMNYILEEVYQHGAPVIADKPQIEIAPDQVGAFIPLNGFREEDMINYFMHGTIIPCVLCVLALNGEMILSDERTDNLKRFWGVQCEERAAALTYAVPFSVQGNLSLIHI